MTGGLGYDAYGDPARGRPEQVLVEDPAIATLEALGWRLTPLAEVQRVGPRSGILQDRLEAALMRLNPWMTSDGLARVAGRVVASERAGLLEGNREVHEALTRGVSVRLDEPGGLPSRTAQLVDYTDVTRNEFLVVRQFPLSGGGGRRLAFDLALFVNGVLWAVLECKYARGDVGAALAEGYRQLERYQGLKDYVGRGAPAVFASVQALGVLCGSLGTYGAVGAGAGGFAPFPEAYPMGAAWLAETLGLSSGAQAGPQEVLLYSVFSPANLLEFARSYTVYEVKDGRLVRKLARHQQRVAVDRVARRVLGHLSLSQLQETSADVSELDPKQVGRGGVIWHTQGSGKSLTMVWLAQKLRQPELGLENPTIVVVTDRVSLDTQVAGVFAGAGFPLPRRATSSKELRELLTLQSGVTVMTTVQKFADFARRAGRRAAGRRIFVLVDEAHRTQYGDMAEAMRSALPQATFVAFTGTPIEKRDRSTMRVFGPYIHRYTMLEAVRDKATVPIYYEGRDVGGVFLAKKDIDALLGRWLPDATDDELEEVRRKHATLEAVAGARSRMASIAKDITDHFEAFIAPGGFKGQVVASSRENAVRYLEALRELNGPQAEVVFTVGANDPDRLSQFDRTAKELSELTRAFAEDRTHPVKLLIVVDMLLTGFDAPLEQVMYLDRPLSEHSLLQAIARVNRVADEKEGGYVVDYWGVTQDLKDALRVFDERDVQGVMRPLDELRQELEVRHRRIMRIFGGEQEDLERAWHRLEDPPVRQEFEVAYRQLSQTINALLPNLNNELVRANFGWLTRVRQRASERIDRQERSDLSGIGAKVRKLIDDVVVADDVVQVHAPVNILAPDFVQQAQALPTLEAVASEMMHAANHEISLKFPQNPAVYQTLRQRLEDIIERQRQRRLDSAQMVEELRGVVEGLRTVSQGRAHSTLSADAEALYALLHAAGTENEDLARRLETTIKALLVVDWTFKEDVQREMRKQVKRELRTAGVDASQLEVLTAGVLDVARARLA